MCEMNPKVDEFINKANQWQEEYKTLRMIVKNSQLTEEIKWGVPCYTYQNSNVILIHGFKDYCAILFVKGVLLKDENGILIQQTANVQAGRQIRFKNVQEIIKIESILKAYINEAIEIEKLGLKVQLKSESELKYPEEFQIKLDEIPALKIAFDALSPGRKRAYNLYFSAPKQAKTRETRVGNFMQKILEGKGLND